jgi:glycine cleavage system transcriptional repressor
MSNTIVFTLTGSDRVGIVEEVTGVLLGLGGNIQTSRMARLGGEFAMLVLLSLPAEKVGELDSGLAYLTDHGYKTTMCATDEAASDSFAGWLPYLIEVRGADHEGIIHDIAAGLSHAGISIESMETGTSPAAVSGLTLFNMSAVVMVPPGLADTDWIAALDEAGQRANVDIEATKQ